MGATRHFTLNRQTLLILLAAGTGIIFVGVQGFALLKRATAFRSQHPGISQNTGPAPDSSPFSPPVPVLVERHLQLMDQQLQLAQPPAAPTAEPAPSSASAAVPLYTAQGLRDPLASLLPVESRPSSLPTEPNAQPAYQPPPSPPPSLTVQGLLWGTESPKAIINGQVCKIGDNVSGAIIKSITRQGIELEFQGAMYLATTTGSMTVLPQGAQGR